MTLTKPATDLPRRSPRGQRGFALGASQMTLALVSLVVGATAITLDDGAKAATDQEAHIHASYLLKAGSGLQTALERAVGDNGLARSDASAVLRFEQGPSRAGTVSLFDEHLGYGRAPQWPAGLIVPEETGAGVPRWSAEAADVVEVAGVDLDVCRRFNEMTQGEDPEAAPPADIASALHDRGWQQGRVAAPGEAAGTWYMRAFAVALCVGERCKAGDVVGAAARRMIDGPPAPSTAPPPWVPQGPRSIGAAAADPVVPSIYIVGKRDANSNKLTQTSLTFHNLSRKRALKLAEALEAAAKQLRDPKNHDRVFDMKDPGVSVDVTAALNSAD